VFSLIVFGGRKISR